MRLHSPAECSRRRALANRRSLRGTRMTTNLPNVVKLLGWCVAVTAIAGIAGARQHPSQTAKVIVDAGRAGCRVDLDAGAAGTTDPAGKLTIADVDPGDHYLHVLCPGKPEA